MLGFVFFLQAAALANLAHSATLDLKGAVEHALVNSPALRESREKLEQSKFQKYSLTSSLFPKIDLSASQTYRKDAVANRSAVAFGGEPYNAYSLSVRGDQPLFVYGTFSGLSQSEYSREITEVEMEIKERDLIRSIISAYYRTLMNDRLLKIYQEQEKVVQEILVTAQRRLSLGGKKIDVLQVRTQLALLKPKIAKAKNELESSAAELANLLGMSENLELTLKGDIPSLAMKEMGKFLDLKVFNLPELKKVRLQRESLDEEKSVALGKHLPSLRLQGDYSFNNYTKSELMQDASNSWSAMLLLEVPLFSGLSSYFDRRALTSKGAQLELSELEIKNRLVLEQIKARKALETAETSLASAEEAAKLARDSLNEARREYRFGIMDFLGFLQVEKADFEAASSLLQLRFDAIKAYSDYFAASGQPLNILVNLLNEGEKK
jgi:outer membrane protein TolC